MSRIGKQPINIPDKVEITIEGETVKAKGPLGELALEIPFDLELKKEEKSLVLTPKKKDKRFYPIWGLYRALLFNVVQGVSAGFEKKLQIEGVGYRAEVRGNELVLSLGFSHPVVMEIPEGLKILVEKNMLTISGIDKQKLGQMAADIRAYKKPEPYKGKGIRYEGEHVRRKAGKRAVAGGGK